MGNKRNLIVEKVWNYEGYNCAVLFHPLGHRCGYVEVPKNSKYYGKRFDYNTYMNFYFDDINVNGGVNYSTNYLHSVSNEEDNRWWIGWDYAHCWDGFDRESYLKYYGKDDNYEDQIECCMGCSSITYLEDAIKDCEYVVRQLIEKEEEQ